MHLFTFLCRVTQGISYKERQTEGTQTSSLTFQFNTFNSYPLLWNKSQLLTLTFTSLHALSPSGHSNIPPPLHFHLPSTSLKWKYLTFPKTSLYLLGYVIINKTGWAPVLMELTFHLPVIKSRSCMALSAWAYKRDHTSGNNSCINHPCSLADCCDPFKVSLVSL